MLRLRYVTAVLLALALLALGWVGGYFFSRSLFRGSRPAAREPVVIEVTAAYPGAAAEEVERQVTIPLEVTLAGMPGLRSLRSRSVPGLGGVYARFDAGTTYEAARQEVINRLATIGQPLPPGVTPQVGPGPGLLALRYTLTAPRDAWGRPVYALRDLKALQDWVLEREFRRVPGVLDASSVGGTLKRYEIRPDPDRLKRYGITLQQLADAVAKSNANANAFLDQGDVALNVRGVGLFGGGQDPVNAVLGMKDPVEAAGKLRAEEGRRIKEIRALVIAAVNNVPVTVEDVVEGGRVGPGEELGKQGVVTAGGDRAGWVGCMGPGAFADDDAVQGVVLLRPDEDAGRWRDVEARIRELNASPDRVLPGVHIEPYHTSGEAGLWVYGLLPENVSLEGAAERARKVRELLKELPEVERVVSQVGRSEDGTNLQTFNQVQIFVGLKPSPDGPGRSRAELMVEIDSQLARHLPGSSWWTTAKTPEELEWAFPGLLAENLLAIVGPDLDDLERLAGPVQQALRGVPGLEHATAYRSRGLPRLEVRIDSEKCKRWGVSVSDVSAVLRTALGGKEIARLIEGEKTFDITLRFPPRMRGEAELLDLPLDVVNNQIVLDRPPQVPDPDNPIKATPRLRMRDLVSPAGKDGEPNPNGEFRQPGTGAIYRAQGKRLLPVGFSVRGRPLAEVRAEAATKIAPLLKEPYRLEWVEP
jgi:Cu/Ag efflux pump CusA